MHAEFNSGDIRYKPHPKWDSLDEDGNYSPGSVWIKMAKFYASRSYSIIPCVQAKFRHSVQHKKTSIYKIAPNQFFSPFDDDLYEAATYEEGDEIKYKRNSEAAALSVKIHEYSAMYRGQGLDKREIWLSAILNPDTAVGPMMRTCVVFSEDLVHKNFYQHYLPATACYVQNPAAYDRYWKDIIPQQIKQSKELLHAYLMK